MIHIHQHYHYYDKHHLLQHLVSRLLILAFIIEFVSLYYLLSPSNVISYSIDCECNSKWIIIIINLVMYRYNRTKWIYTNTICNTIIRFIITIRYFIFTSFFLLFCFELAIFWYNLHLVLLVLVWVHSNRKHPLYKSENIVILFF